MTTPGSDLIPRLAAGDRGAFAPFYDRHASLVYSLVLRIVRDPADAADVLHQVFWDAWQAADSYDPTRSTPEAWLLMRARNRAVEHVRGYRGRGARVHAAPAMDEVALDRDGAPTALLALPDRERRVLELAYWHGYTQTEIARGLTLASGTVQTRIRAGLEALRTALGDT